MSYNASQCKVDISSLDQALRDFIEEEIYDPSSFLFYIYKKLDDSYLFYIGDDCQDYNLNKNPDLPSWKESRLFIYIILNNHIEFQQEINSLNWDVLTQIVIYPETIKSRTLLMFACSFNRYLIVKHLINYSYPSPEIASEYFNRDYYGNTAYSLATLYVRNKLNYSKEEDYLSLKLIYPFITFTTDPDEKYHWNLFQKNLITYKEKKLNNNPKIEQNQIEKLCLQNIWFENIKKVGILLNPSSNIFLGYILQSPDIKEVVSQLNNEFYLVNGLNYFTRDIFEAEQFTKFIANKKAHTSFVESLYENKQENHNSNHVNYNDYVNLFGCKVKIIFHICQDFRNADKKFLAHIIILIHEISEGNIKKIVSDYENCFNIFKIISSINSSQGSSCINSLSSGSDAPYVKNKIFSADFENENNYIYHNANNNYIVSLFNDSNQLKSHYLDLNESESLHQQQFVNNNNNNSSINYCDQETATMITDDNLSGK